MKKITRQQAMEQGLKRYYTGKPCKHGHYSERLCSDYACCECVSIRVKSARQRMIDEYGEERAKELLRSKWRAHSQQLRKDNPEHMREYMREYMNEYRKTPAGREATKRARQNYRQRKANAKVSKE